MGTISAPAPLNTTHDTTQFDSGNPTLNEWLSKRAMKNQDSGASKTFVICHNQKPIGYYALATGSVERVLAPSNFSRRMPDPIPVIILARLAIDTEFQGQKLGASLLKDAMLRTLSIAKHVGVRGLLVHAISENAKRFYLNYGFQASPLDPMTLLLTMYKLNQHLPS